MTRGRVGALVSVCVGLALLPVVPSAAADSPGWNGDYEITFIDGPKSGTSLAAGQPEQQYSDVYTFQSSCAGGQCTATIINGPAPRNPTVPQPVRFTWDGTSWTQVNNFQWECRLDDGTVEWNPARADVRYTPQPDGSLAGTMRTDISSGACQGTVEMNMAARRV